MPFYQKTPNFFAIEGTDGSGKATQTTKLNLRLQKEGYKAGKISSPSYGCWYCAFVDHYKKGNFGPMTEVDPYQAALYFAMCRSEEGRLVKEWFKKGELEVVIADRWMASNLAHQGAKFSEEPGQERTRFMLWLKELEHHRLAIPMPQLYIVLDVLPETSAALLQNRAQKSGGALDGHEANLAYQQKVRRIYLWLAERFPKDYQLVQCCRDDGAMKSEEEIHEAIWQIIQPLLPSRSKQ